MYSIKFYILFYSTIYAVVSQGQYSSYKDWMSFSDKAKLKRMTRLYMWEAQNYIKQVDRLRDEYYTAKAFEVGMIMGQIREKYKTMLELYRMTYNKFSNRSKLAMPRVAKRRTLHYIIRMEFIRAIEIDIDQLIFILEDSGKKKDRLFDMLQQLQSSKTKKPGLRSYLPFDGYNMEFRRNFQDSTNVTTELNKTDPSLCSLVNYTCYYS